METVLEELEVYEPTFLVVGSSLGGLLLLALITAALYKVSCCFQIIFLTLSALPRTRRDSEISDCGCGVGLGKCSNLITYGLALGKLLGLLLFLLYEITIRLAS